MINYLKESTFAVNDVIQKAWGITKKHYFSIATLCFLMFITASASSLMAFFIKDVSKVLSVIMAIVFVFLYFTINLSLFKYIFHLMDDEDNDVKIVDTLPTRQQIIRFLIATLYFVGCILFIGLILFPVLYILDPVLRYLVKIGWVESFQTTGVVITQIAVGIAILALFITWLRISFFPFFIIDKNAAPFESIKLSLAITKGNFTKILLLLLVLGGGYLIYLLFNLLHWPFVAFVVNILSSFIIVPLSSVALTVAYRKIAGEYKGDEHPDILHNIV
ncbi:hypothetical protein EZ449_11525 [Pedobacter frigidisoli]|uniref:Glycerophosphoryl diester phosphodiesterase membrane domain-containing protein n=1 Tax=Pedobacter frigidisoli TaxID=2530455 RepID=A0A4R0NZZ1_9SPHI|nr:hypothetical protein [Pedobacter frigidisoli]TCD08471.1 hypothetical protein EZ449_11525 [Pedobacter frigidisoli]